MIGGLVNRKPALLLLHLPRVTWMGVRSLRVPRDEFPSVPSQQVSATVQMESG